jgi:signal peptidase I
MRALLVLGAALAALAVFLLRTTRRFRVEGRSMLPAFAPGDRVLALMAPWPGRPRRGDVVVVRGPEGRLDIKRVAGTPGEAVETAAGRLVLAPGQWFLLGDNLPESTDSRHIGSVPASSIVGRVLLTY